MNAEPAAWFWVPEPRPEHDMRLICLPWSGADVTVFRQWPKHLGPSVEMWAVRFSGRGRRWAEDPPTDFGEASASLVSAVQSCDTGPVAIFGHSLGALFAFELARALGSDCRQLFVSAMAAPHVREHGPRLSTASDERVLALLARLNDGLPQELRHPELQPILLSRIRADIALAESYEYRPERSVQAPVTVFAATSDTHTSHAEIEAWRDVVPRVVGTHWFEGGHMFIREHEAAVCEVVRQSIAPTRAGSV